MDELRCPRRRRFPRLAGAFAALLVALAAGSPADAGKPPASWRKLAPTRVALAPPDVDAVLARDAARIERGELVPWRIAAAIERPLGLADGRHYRVGDREGWRWEIASPGAEHLGLHFDRFVVPAGARLWVEGANGEALGPLGRADRNGLGELWVPALAGDRLTVTLDVPRGHGRDVRLRIAEVFHGFRPLGRSATAVESLSRHTPPSPTWRVGEGGRGGEGGDAVDAVAISALPDQPRTTATNKKLPCHVETSCAQAADWQREVRSVAMILIQGEFECTGTLVNDTIGSHRPFVLTVRHCIELPEDAESVSIVWGFESPRCDAPGGGSRLAYQLGGAVLRASWEHMDGTLIELNSPPDPAFDLVYAGWDANDYIPNGLTAIGHPRGEEMAIAFERDRPITGRMDGNTNVPPNEAVWWGVRQWEEGTIEPGNSGSCLWDPASRRCLGTVTALSFFQTDCAIKPETYSGRTFAFWNGTGTPDTALRFWLDAAGTGRNFADAIEAPDPVGAPGGCAPGSLCLLGGRYEVTASWHNQYDGSSGVASASSASDFAGFFAFTDPANVELMVKLIDFGDTVKVFYGQLTDLDFRLRVRETATGRSKAYRNTRGDCGAIDQAAFPKALGSATACTPSTDRLCLLDGRFAVEVDWRNQYNGATGSGTAAPLSRLTGLFSYDDPANVELLVKALDFGDKVLLLWGSLSDLEYSLRVTDTASGEEKRYDNPAGHFCGGLDPDF